MRRIELAALFAVTLLAFGCDGQAQPAAQEPTWLDTAGAPLPVIARQLRGLDMAMMEIDYRYAELYHGGTSRNWAYAKYQLDKLKLAMDLALERRPQRAKSAQTFYYPALAALNDAVEAQDSSRFADRFRALRDACNACHQAERVPTFTVEPPGGARSSIRPIE